MRGIPSSPADWERVYNAVESAPTLGFDTEFSGPLKVGTRSEFVDPLRASLTGCSLAASDLAVYVPIAHRTGNVGMRAQNNLWKAFDARKKAGLVVVAHNARAEMSILRRHGVDTRGWKFGCTQVGAFLGGIPSSDPDRPFALKPWALTHLNRLMMDFSQVTGGYDFSQLDPTKHPLAVPYAVEDAEAALEAYELILPRLREWGLEGTYWNLEMPLCELLSRIEENGVGIDLAMLDVHWDKWREEQALVEREWASLNPGIKMRGPSLQLFWELGEWPTRFADGSRYERNKSGKGWSTSRENLERIYDLVPDGRAKRSMELKMRHSVLDKLTGTFAPNLVDIADSYPDGRLHVDIFQTETRTGRLSCAFLQQIPTRSKDGKVLRDCIVAAPGSLMVGIDHSQIEPRVLADITGKGALYDAYTADRKADAYQAIANELGISRGQAKILLLSIVYGVGKAKTAKGLRVGMAEAEEILGRFRARLPELPAFKAAVVAAGRARGYVKTRSGRRRYLPGLRLRGNDEESRKQRGMDERRAGNTPIQGSARDVMVECMLAVDRLGLTDVKPCLQVHDEMLYECPPERAQEAAAAIQHEFENAVKLKVGLSAEAKVGERWSECK